MAEKKHMGVTCHPADDALSLSKSVEAMLVALNLKNALGLFF